MANYISKITLPSGATYDIKDASAWAAIGALTGISFSVAWNGSSAPTVANIPKGVTVTYQGTAYTGTKEASTANTGTFYLVYSGTQKDETDIYDEYVVITNGSTKTWEKIGDTGAKFSDIVLKKQTESVIKTVSIDKQPTFSAPGTTTDEVLGSGTTFTVSKPGVTVSNTSTFLGASVSGGSVNIDSSVKAITGFGAHTTKNALGANATFTTTVTPTTTNIKATASSANTAWNSKDAKTVLTGVKVTAQPTITLNSSSGTSTGAIAYLDGGSVSRTTGVAVGSNGTASAVTGYPSPAKSNVLGTSASFTTSVTPSTAVIKATASGAALGTATKSFVTSYPGSTSKLTTTSIYGVGSTTTTASKATAATSQTTATGAMTDSETNTDLLKGASVTGETLVLGAAKLTTQTTTQYTFADVTVPIKNTSTTTVATGNVSTGSSGATVLIGLGIANTDNAIIDASVKTQPTIALATGGSGTGTVTVATGIASASTEVDDAATVSAITGLGTASTSTVLTGVKVTTQPEFEFNGTTKHLTGTASGTTVGSDGTASVIGSGATFTITQPTITLATNSSAGTGMVTVATGATATTEANAKDTVTAITALGTASTANAITGISHTNPTVTLTSSDTSAAGRVKVLTGSSAELSATPTVTVGANDKVNAVITVAAPTRSQDVTLNTSTASVLLSTTDVSINS